MMTSPGNKFDVEEVEAIYELGDSNGDDVLGTAQLDIKTIYDLRVLGPVLRIRVTPKRPDPTGSGSYLEMILMFSKINEKFLAFLYQI